MNLLVTEQVYSLKIAVAVLAAFRFRYSVVRMYLFTVEECVTTSWAYSLLLSGKLLFTGHEVFRFHRIPLCPLCPEMWVVRGSMAFDQTMPFD